MLENFLGFFSSTHRRRCKVLGRALIAFVLGELVALTAVSGGAASPAGLIDCGVFSGKSSVSVVGSLNSHLRKRSFLIAVSKAKSKS